MNEDLHLLCKVLDENKNCIQQVIHHPESSYTSFTKPKMKFGRPQLGDKGKIKPRYLTPPVPSLKLLQREICYHLQTIDLPACMYGSVDESNNILNALQHIDNKFFLTIDLKSFFDNITNTQVHQLLINNNLPWREARILTKLTTYKHHLPQGAPTSPVLANLAFANTARQLQTFIKKHQITFTTFLDDLTFSSKRNFQFLIPDLLRIIRENNFYPHREKIKYHKDVTEITGLLVGNGKLRLTAEMKKEALTNPRVKAYALLVDRLYKEYLKERKK